MKHSCSVLIGYDYDIWYGYGDKIPVEADMSINENSSTLICGMSGSGKSYLLNQYFARLCIQGGTESKVYFADFKQDNIFSHLRQCPRYYPFDKSIEALESVYDILHRRQSGEDKSQYPVTFIWDEYVANVLALQGLDKKKADAIMRKVSEILMIGRTLGVRMITSCQRCDAAAFPIGSRLNYGVVIIVGAPIRSIYEMLLPNKEYIDKIGDRQFKTGEGVVLLKGSDMRYIKVPMVRDEKMLQEICIDALTR